MHVFRERFSVCLCASSPFGFEGGIWDLIVLVPGHFLSFLLSKIGFIKHFYLGLENIKIFLMVMAMLYCLSGSIFLLKMQ